MTDRIFFSFDLSWLNMGYAVFRDRDGKRWLYKSGSFSAPPLHGKHVCLRDQLDRAGKLFSDLCHVLRANDPFVGVDGEIHVGYETPKVWMHAKHQTRGGTSGPSVLSFGYAEAVLWLALIDVFGGREFSLYALDPNRWHAVMEGLVAPQAAYDELREKWTGEDKPIKLKAAMFCKVVYDFIPATDHEADAVAMGTYLMDVVGHGDLPGERIT